MSRKIYIIIAMVFTVVLSVSTFFIIRNHIDSAKQNEVYDNLAEIVEDEPPKENEGVTFSEDKDYLAEYLELYRQNEDIVGWIKVEDTNINNPVVQSVNEPNVYLKHKFDKSYSAYGCAYVQENCDEQKPSDNINIYGHHMNDGSMFTGLMKYRNKSFWEEHKAITFDTLTDRHQYEVIAVFKTVVYTNSSDSFKYYEFTDAENAAEFDAYVVKCKELSLYDTGVSAEYGDKLISLRRGQIPAILRIPQLDTLHKIRSISAAEQFLRCIEVFPVFFCESIPEIKGKVADLDCATCLPTAVHTFRYDAVPLKIKHLSDIHSRFF